MRRAVLQTSIVLVALGFAACSPASVDPVTPVEDPVQPAAEAPPPATIAGGGVLTPQGWGGLRIGMTAAEVEAALGPDANPAAVGGADPATCDEFRPANAPAGMRVMIENGVLTRISVVEPSDAKTSTGLGIGAAAADVKQAYGDQATVTPHKYVDAPAEYITVWEGGPRSEPYVEDEAARGIVFEVNATGHVSAIHTGGPSIQYVEGCS